MAAGSDDTGDSTGIADTLLSGDLAVYVNNTGGFFTADELARIGDTIAGLDSLLAPYHVILTEVSDAASANLVLDAGMSSACGSPADGVLGCFNGAAGEITILQGWNWYAGSDPTQIGPDQYDFQTTLTHELGHALGLGGANDPNSPMHETLAAGVTHRVLTVPDLNISKPPEGADPLTAASHAVEAAPVFPSRTQPAVATGETGIAGPASGDGFAALLTGEQGNSFAPPQVQCAATVDPRPDLVPATIARPDTAALPAHGTVGFVVTMTSSDDWDGEDVKPEDTTVPWRPDGALPGPEPSAVEQLLGRAVDVLPAPTAALEALFVNRPWIDLLPEQTADDSAALGSAGVEGLLLLWALAGTRADPDIHSRQGSNTGTAASQHTPQP
jgi:hypothetical protein